MISACLATTLLAAQPGDPQVPKVVRVHRPPSIPLPALPTSARDRVAPIAPCPYARIPDWALTGTDYGYDEALQEWPSIAIDAITSLVEPDAWESVGRWVASTADGSLCILAEPALQERVEAVLAHFERGLAQDLRLGLRVYQIPDRDAYTRAAEEAQAGDAAAFERWAASRGLEPAVRLSLGLHSGEPFRARSGQDVRFVSDLDGEIAQSGVIHHPIVSTLELGSRIWGLASRDPAGGVVVEIALRHAWLEGEVEDVDCLPRTYVVDQGPQKLEVPGRIQSPPVAFCALRGGAILQTPGDRALLFAGLEDGRGPVAVAAVLELEDFPPYEPVLELPGGVAVGVLDLASRAVRPTIPPFPRSIETLTCDESNTDPTLTIAFPPDPRGAERLGEAVSAVESMQDEGPLPILLGTRAVLWGPAEEVRRAVGFMASVLRSPRSEAIRLLGSDGGLVVSLPVTDAGGFVVAGRQRALVSDWDAEVADNAVIAQPNTSYPLDGVAVAVEPRAESEARLIGLWHLRLDRGAVLGETRTTGLVHTPSFAVATLSGILHRGEETDVGGPSAADGAKRFLCTLLGGD